VWINCQPAPQRVLGPQLFVSTCPCTPRCGFPSPGSPVPSHVHVIFLLLLFLTIRPVNTSAAAASFSFSDSIDSKSAARPPTFPRARHRPFLACDVILAESRFAKPVASTAPFVNRARQHSPQPQIQPRKRLTARARGIGIQQFAPPELPRRVSALWSDILRCSLSEVRKFDFSRQPRITSQFPVVPSRFHRRPSPIDHHPSPSHASPIHPLSTADHRNTPGLAFFLSHPVTAAA